MTRLASMVCLCALAAAGCADDPTATTAVRTPDVAQHARASAPGRPQLWPNSVRYRDTSLPGAVGRSGNATLDVTALMDADGHIDLAVSAGAPGVLDKVQIRTISESGRQLAVKNVQRIGLATFVHTVPGHEGHRFQVQANISGVDFRRTGVVTVVESVKRRPDLAVTSIDAALAAVGAPAIILASVRELNGDVGAHATCELLVDDVVVDAAAGIWVDRDGHVECALTHTFDDAGTLPVTVRLTGVDPADWDPANNELATSVVILDPGNDDPGNGDDPPAPVTHTVFAWNATASDLIESRTLHRTGFTQQAGSRTEWDYQESEVRDIRESSIDAYSYEGLVTFPADVRVREWTAGILVHDLVRTALPATYEHDQDGVNYRCGQFWEEVVLDGRTYYPANLNVCAEQGAGISRTRISHQRFAGDVVYLSHGTYFAWTGADLEDFVDYSYAVTSSGAAAVPGDLTHFGSTYRWEIRITAGHRTFLLDRTVPVHPVHDAGQLPQLCFEHTLPGYSDRSCSTESWSVNGSRGAGGGLH